MVEKNLARVGGILSLGVFGINVYLGLYDSTLQSQLTGSTTGIPLHWYLNWVIAVITLVAAIILLLKPLDMLWVALAGIVWPMVYVASLGFDVFTTLCAGGGYCWPSKTAAFQYLILNNPNADGGGWKLFQGTIPTALGLLFITWALSIWVLISLRRASSTKAGAKQMTVSPGSTAPGSPVTGPQTPTRNPDSKTQS